MLEEEEEEPEAELEAEQEAKLDLEAQLESEPQELSPRSEDKKKVGQKGGLSALPMPPAGLVGHACIMDGDLLYPEVTNLNVSLIQKTLL